MVIAQEPHTLYWLLIILDFLNNRMFKNNGNCPEIIGFSSEKVLFQIDLKVHLLASSVPSDRRIWEGFSVLLKDTLIGLCVTDWQSSCGGDAIWHCLLTGQPHSLWGSHLRGHRRLLFYSSHIKLFELCVHLLKQYWIYWSLHLPEVLLHLMLITVHFDG